MVADRAHDLDDLPLGERDVLDQRAAGRCGRCRGRRAAPPPAASMRPRSIRPSRPRGSRAISRFSATVIQGSRVSSWNTVPDAERVRHPPGRRGRPRWPSMRIARVGPQPAAEHLDQGALAGAVLADQRVHLAGATAEGGVVAAPARRRSDLVAAPAASRPRTRPRRAGGAVPSWSLGVRSARPPDKGEGVTFCFIPVRSIAGSFIRPRSSLSRPASAPADGSHPQQLCTSSVPGQGVPFSAASTQTSRSRAARSR